MSRHRNRTTKGDKLKQAHEETYQRWWLGKYVKGNGTVNGKPAEGIVVKVEYIGNSVYGIVKLYFENGCEYIVGGRGYRPRKEDVLVVKE